MKKYLGICFAIVLVSFATGCGSKTKTLKCSMEQNLSVYEMKQDVNLSFKKDSITKMEIIQNVKVDETYSSYIGELEKTLATTFDSYKDTKGFDISTKTDGNTIKTTLVADFSKMDDETKKSLDIVDTTAKYDDAKKAFETQGYSCK